MKNQIIDGNALKSYIHTHLGSQLADGVVRAIYSAIDRQPVIDAEGLFKRLLIEALDEALGETTKGGQYGESNDAGRN